MVYQFSRPGVDFELRTTTDAVKPGEDLEVEVSVLPHQEFQVRTGRLRLDCVETYWVPGGKSGPTRETTRHSRIEVFFAQDAVFSPGLPYETITSLRIPADSIHSVAGTHANIRWNLRASLNIAGATDIRRERTILVLPLNKGVGNNALTEETKLGRGTRSLSLPSNQVEPGGSLIGVLTVNPEDEVNFRELRVELECYEKAGVSSKENIVTTIKLEDHGPLASGMHYEWPFTLQIPSNAIPTTEVSHTEVTWRVIGKLDRRLRTDEEIELVVQVCP